MTFSKYKQRLYETVLEIKRKKDCEYNHDK